MSSTSVRGFVAAMLEEGYRLEEIRELVDAALAEEYDALEEDDPRDPATYEPDPDSLHDRDR